jgi:hypothetical protein
MENYFKKSTEEIFIEEFGHVIERGPDKYNNFFTPIDQGGLLFCGGDSHLLKHITHFFHHSPPLLLSGYDLPSSECLRDNFSLRGKVGGSYPNLYIRGVELDIYYFGLKTNLMWFPIYSICKRHMEGARYLKEDGEENIFFTESISYPGLSDYRTTVIFIVKKGLVGWEYRIKFTDINGFFGGSRIFLFSESRYAFNHK